MFLKRTVLVFLSTLLLAAVLAKAIAAPIPLVPALVALLVTIIGLTVSRRLLKRGNTEATISAFGLGSCLLLVTNLLSIAQESGWPLFLLSSQIVLMLVYTLACGRDFSFVGFAAISGLTQIAVNLLIGVYGLVESSMIPLACLFATLFSSYVSYNLAMVMKRRRPEERISPVTDMYRDLLNFTTYPFRVINHWRKYRFDITH